MGVVVAEEHNLEELHTAVTEDSVEVEGVMAEYHDLAELGVADSTQLVVLAEGVVEGQAGERYVLSTQHIELFLCRLLGWRKCKKLLRSSLQCSKQLREVFLRVWQGRGRILRSKQWWGLAAILKCLLDSLKKGLRSTGGCAKVA